MNAEPEPVRGSSDPIGPVLSPYLLNYRPSPGGRRIAVAVASVAEPAGVAISVRNRVTESERRLVRFPELKIVTLAWTPDGTHLAVEQGGLVQIWNVEDFRLIAKLSGRCLGFDRGGALSLLAVSGELLRAQAPYRRSERMDHRIVAACGVPAAAWIRRSSSGQLEVCRAQGDVHPWPLAWVSRPRVQTATDGHCFVSAEDGNGDARRLQIACLRADGSAEISFDASVGLPLGQIEARWVSWRAGAALVLQRDRANSELQLAAGGHVVPIDPPGLVVLDFVASPEAARIAVVGRLGSAKAPRLLLLEDRGASWNTVDLGVAQGIPVFDDAGEILVTPGQEGDATDGLLMRDLENCRESAIEPPGASFVSARETSGHRTVLCLGHLAGGLGYPVRKSNFFQHMIWEITKRLAAESGAVPVHLDGDLMECPPGSFAAAVDWLKTRLASHAQAHSVIVCGSLGAACCLRASSGLALAAQILISPVYSPWVSRLALWSDFLGDDDGQDCVRLAHETTTPTLILHGQRDEVSACDQTGHFALHAPRGLRVVPVQIAQEGHIFAQPGSWRDVDRRTRSFVVEQQP